MTEPRRFAVPLEQLDEVHVGQAQQVQEQADPVDPGAAAWSGSPVHPFGDGMADADGE